MASCGVPAKDWTQSENVAAKSPAKLKQLPNMFRVEAKKYNVLPLDPIVARRLVALGPSITAGRNVFTYAGDFTGTPNGHVPSILNGSYFAVVHESAVARLGSADPRLIGPVFGVGSRAHDARELPRDHFCRSTIAPR
jgi:hypothetical protein